MIVIAYVTPTEIALHSRLGLRAWTRRASTLEDIAGVLEHHLLPGEQPLILDQQARAALTRVLPGLPWVTAPSLSEQLEWNQLVRGCDRALAQPLTLWRQAPRPSLSPTFSLAPGAPDAPPERRAATHAGQGVGAPHLKKARRSAQVWVDYSGPSSDGDPGGIGLHLRRGGATQDVSVAVECASELMAVAYGAALIGQGTVHCDHQPTVDTWAPALSTQGVQLIHVGREHNRAAHHLARQGRTQPPGHPLDAHALGVLRRIRSES